MKKENWKEKCKGCIHFNGFLPNGTVYCLAERGIKSSDEVLKCKDKE